MNHKELEAALNQFKAKKSRQPEELLTLLRKNHVVVPAVMPKNTSPEIMRKMLQNPGKSHAIPEGANPQPCIFENANKEKFLPIFTSEEEMKNGKDVPSFPLSLNLPFEACMQLMQKNNEISGIVINAYTHNIIFRINNNQELPKDLDSKVSLEQYHIILRQRLESFLLPKQLFEGKEEFVTKLCKDRGNCIKELYDGLYDAEIACPYVVDDFEFMVLNISEDLLLGQITMPKKNLVPQTCPSVIFAWNQKLKKVWYYAIVLSAKEELARLFEVHENGKNTDLGEAPAEGSELSAIMDLIQEKSNEK